MKIRDTKTKEEGYSSTFNIHSLNEIIVCFDDQDSDYMTNYDVFIEATEQWMSFKEAFDNNHIICDNYNTCFFEPTNIEDRERGYTL